MLIQVSLKGDNEFDRPTVFVVLVSWLLLVAYWLNRLDLGLKLYPPLFIIPVMQVFFVFFAIICGGIYFEEFNSFDTPQYIGFIAGVLMILGGVFLLAPSDVIVVPPTEDEPQATPLMTGDTDKLMHSPSNRDLERGDGEYPRPARRGSGIGGEGEFQRPVRRGSAGGMVPAYSNLDTSITDELLKAMSPRTVMPDRHVQDTITANASAAMSPVGIERAGLKYVTEGGPGPLPPLTEADSDLLSANRKKRKVVKRVAAEEAVADSLPSTLTEQPQREYAL